MTAAKSDSGPGPPPPRRPPALFRVVVVVVAAAAAVVVVADADVPGSAVGVVAVVVASLLEWNRQRRREALAARSAVGLVVVLAEFQYMAVQKTMIVHAEASLAEN